MQSSLKNALAVGGAVIFLASSVGVAGASVVAGDVQYLGAFKAPNTGSWYEGSLALSADGKSLYLSAGNNSNHLEKISIASLVKSTDRADLNAATVEATYAGTGVGHVAGMAVYNGQLYISDFSGNTGGAHALTIHSLSLGLDSAVTDYTGFSVWTGTGSGLTVLPQAWADTYTGGTQLLSSGHNHGIKLNAINTNDFSTPAVVSPTSSHPTTDSQGRTYNQPDIGGVEWVDLGNGDQSIVVAGNLPTTTAFGTQGGDAVLWFYNVSDIEEGLSSGGHTYDAQPYLTLDVQDDIVDDGGSLYGLSYDPSTGRLYSYSNHYGQSATVYAWQLPASAVPAPASAWLALLGFGLLLVGGRSRRRWVHGTR